MADEYQREFMGGDDAILQDKVVWKQRWLLSLPAGLTLLGAIATYAAAPGFPLLAFFGMVALAAFFAALWMVFAVMRTIVTANELHVQYGLWGPRVPVENIESCEVVEYDWSSYGGWGVKYSVSEKAWAYTISGHGKDVVQLTWRDENGDKMKAVFSADNPDAVVKAVHHAKAAKRSGTNIRIAAMDDAADEAAYQEALAEAEGMADELAEDTDNA